MLAVFDIFTSGISCKKVVLKSMTPISCLSATKSLNTHPSFSDIQTFSNKIIKHTPELFRKFQFKNTRATYGELVKQSSYGQRCFDKLNRSISDYLRCNSVECFFFLFCASFIWSIYCSKCDFDILNGFRSRQYWMDEITIVKLWPFPLNLNQNSTENGAI